MVQPDPQPHVVMPASSKCGNLPGCPRQPSARQRAFPGKSCFLQVKDGIAPSLSPARRRKCCRETDEVIYYQVGKRETKEAPAACQMFYQSSESEEGSLLLPPVLSHPASPEKNQTRDWLMDPWTSPLKTSLRMGWEHFQQPQETLLLGYKNLQGSCTWVSAEP